VRARARARCVRIGVANQVEKFLGQGAPAVPNADAQNFASGD